MPISLAIRRAIIVILGAGSLIIGGFTLNGAITPSSDNSGSIGDESARLAEIDVVDLEANTASSGVTLANTSLRVGGSQGATIDKILTKTYSFNPFGLTPLASTTSFQNVPGAAVGDTVLIGVRGDWAGASSVIRIVGSVTTTNWVDVYYTNGSSTAGSIDLSNASYTLTLISF